MEQKVLEIKMKEEQYTDWERVFIAIKDGEIVTKQYIDTRRK